MQRHRKREKRKGEEESSEGVYLFMPNDGNPLCCGTSAAIGLRQVRGAREVGTVACIEYAAYVT